MLFGHQDDTSQTNGVTPAAADPVAPSDPTVNPLAVDPETGASLPAIPADQAPSLDEPSVLDQPSLASGRTMLQQATPDPTAPFSADPAPVDPAPEPAAPVVTQDPTPAPTMNDYRAPAAPADEGSGDLLDIKQQALSQLGPLVDHLDQTPEERFRTTMMLIQSTDNSGLLKAAYEAAQAIPDEKTRAQALLDVVNEINYFTQQQAN